MDNMLSNSGFICGIVFSDECGLMSQNVQTLRTLLFEHRKYKWYSTTWITPRKNSLVCSARPWCGKSINFKKRINKRSLLLSNDGQLRPAQSTTISPDCYFQQDRALPHTTRAVRSILDEMVQNSWIGRWFSCLAKKPLNATPLNVFL